MPKGGARPGSGTKPGPKYQRVTGALNALPIESQELPKPAVDSACALMARGMSYSEVARRLSYDRHTVAGWAVKYRDRIIQHTERMLDPAAFVEPLMGATFTAVADSLKAPADPTVRLNAAKLTMAYRFGAPAQRVESRSLNVHRVIIEDMRGGLDGLDVETTTREALNLTPDDPVT